MAWKNSILPDVEFSRDLKTFELFILRNTLRYYILYRGYGSRSNGADRRSKIASRVPIKGSEQNVQVFLID